jgi:hypothetical protein
VKNSTVRPLTLIKAGVAKKSKCEFGLFNAGADLQFGFVQGD